MCELQSHGVKKKKMGITSYAVYVYTSLSSCFPQDLKIELPPEHPRAAWSVLLFPYGDLEMPSDLEVEGVTFELDGQLHGVRNVTIGHGGVFIIK